MAVQVWIGEKPEHPNERRAIVALANGLERLDGLYLLLANFSVGGRAIDLVIIKQDAIFIVELKHCDGKVFGDVNGPWFVENANGGRKRLNPGRKNPYNQVITYYYALINFLNEKRGEFLSPNRASSIDFRTCKRLIVIAPTLQEGSKIEIDWKVECKGFDELPAYLVTERSSEIELTDEEMVAIPQMLHCTRWHEVNALVAGVLPSWSDVPDEVPAVVEAAPVVAEPAPQPTPATDTRPSVVAPAPTLMQRAQRSLRTTTGRVAAGLGALTLVLAAALAFRPAPQPTPIDQGDSVLISTAGPAGGLGGGVGAATSCVWSGYQPVGRQLDGQNDTWKNVGVLGAAPDLSPDVVVTLEEVSFCDGTTTLTWSVQNNMDQGDATLPLTNANIVVRDGNTTYAIDEAASKPAQIVAKPGQQARGTAVITGAGAISSTTLTVMLNEQPFGEAMWLVPVSSGA